MHRRLTRYLLPLLIGLAPAPLLAQDEPDPGSDAGDATSSPSGEEAGQPPEVDDAPEADAAPEDADEEAPPDQPAAPPEGADEAGGDTEQAQTSGADDQGDPSPPPGPPEEQGEEADEDQEPSDLRRTSKNRRPKRRPDAGEQPPPPPPDDGGDSGFEPPPGGGFEPPPGADSPISELAGRQDEDFVPLEDINEEVVDPIFPARVYPYIDWNGQFRFRQIAAVGFDLGTGGTSAILPPSESYVPSGNPADPEARTLWSSNFMARLEPTVSITEGIRLHFETDLLGNQVMGSLPIAGLDPNPLRPDPSRNHVSSAQFSAREREWYQNALSVNEAYGELSGFFGTLRAGRMDNHWGLGMFYNDGDCRNCNFGDSIDRVMLQSQYQGFYANFTVDFPGEGPTSQHPNSPLGQPYDLSQLDEIDQYTARIFYAPQDEFELERQRQRLKQREPVFNGGALFSWRTQEGTFRDPFGGVSASQTSPETTAETNPLIYRGVRMYLGDVWAEFLYEPSAKTKMRIGLEAMAVFGSIDNATFDPVGQQSEEDQEGARDLNCFNEDVRGRNPETCLANSRDFQQYALAIESHFIIDSPVSFGLNGGLASGGDAPNWGYGAQSWSQGDDLDFYRFDPDYQIDLILFRQVIGSVTNATYINPYMQATFLDENDYHLRLDLDAIGSRAWNRAGTPAGDSPWLGVEVDAALRFFLKQHFHAAVEGGLLFPMAGLNAVAGRPRLTQYGATNNPEFVTGQEASTPWTVQFHLNWSF